MRMEPVNLAKVSSNCRAVIGLSGAILLAALMGGCAEQPKLVPKFPFLSVDDRPHASEAGEIGKQLGVVAPTEASLKPGPLPPKVESEAASQNRGTKLVGESKGIALEQVPLPAFIDTVFGQTLGLTYQVDPAVTARTETVTLRTGGTRTPQELFEIAQGVLKTYGIRVTAAEGVTRIVSDQALSAEMPQIIRGRTAAEVPSTLRPIFQVVFLTSVPPQDMQNWLIVAFGKRVTVTSFGGNGFLLVSGLPDDVRAVLDAIRLLDQPRLAGRQSLKIEPVYWGVDRLGRKLIEVLRAEGYNASNSIDSAAAILLLPVETINMLLVFTSEPSTAAHVAEWIHELDRPAKADPFKKTFIYPVTSTTADSLGDVLGSIVGGSDGGRRSAAASSSGPTSQVPSMQSGGLSSSLPGQQLGANSAPLGIGSPAADAGPRSVGGGTGPRIVVDELQNAIIVMGTAEEYAQILPILQSLDKTPREALIEVTVAEVTLKESEQLGVEWALSLGLPGGDKGALGTLGGLGVSGAGAGTTTTSSTTNPLTGAVTTTTTTTGGNSSGGSGLNFNIINSASQVRAVLNAFASDNRVNILLTPRLLARSGSEAQIKVGNEVPIITSQSNSPITSGGTTSILNQVSYRTTGTLLRVKPTVHAGDRIDLDIAQEVSDAQTNNVSSVSSPLIFNRSISTRLSLRDGATVLLGGLIQENRSTSGSKVPWIGDVPGLGNLFKSSSGATTRTELLIFITPYIVRTSEDAERITGQFQEIMNHWPDIQGRVTW